MSTLLHGEKGLLNGCSSTRVSLWNSLKFGRLAMGFANVRAGTRVLMLVLVQASCMRLAPAGTVRKVTLSLVDHYCESRSTGARRVVAMARLAISFSAC